MSTANAEEAHHSSPFTRDDFAAVPYLRHDQFISLIHWTMVDGEWRYTTIHGHYLHRDERFWYLRVQGASTRLGRTEWAIFS
ncbi:hypothetical protein [Leifsonia shinshuensis]|uniref:Uncharacterized protein n=1 Tax=Leifsonia shinshuensis TaxID=150026 RepID=A0A7G6YET1_9MICO|nr:hypothetical protein [Leifsonia shinshuensis]QNE36996.1 hypothetical protein F1C12_19015 [Leifsonia shinshuensis]